MRFINAFFLFFISLVFFQCKEAKKDTTTETVVIKDVMGRSVHIPKNVTKIVGVNAGSMRFISYFDAVDKVVGVEETERRASRPYNLAYPEIAKIPAIGPQPGGDAELIMKSQPDVILITVPSARIDVEDLHAKTGIPVVAIENGHLGPENDKIFNTIRIVGEVLGEEERAEELITFMSDEMNDLQERTQSIKDEDKPSVYVGGLSYNGPHGIVSTRSDFTPFVLTNSKNVVAGPEFEKFDGKPIMLDVEKVIQWNPDYIFVDSEGWLMAQNEMKKGTTLYKTLKAIRDNKVYIVPRYMNNSVSYDYALIDAWYVGKTLYPKAFEDVDIDAKVKSTLEEFYNKEVDVNDFDVVYEHIKL